MTDQLTLSNTRYRQQPHHLRSSALAHYRSRAQSDLFNRHEAHNFAQLAGTFQNGPRKGEKASFTGHAFLLFYPLNRIRILH